MSRYVLPTVGSSVVSAILDRPVGKSTLPRAPSLPTSEDGLCVTPQLQRFDRPSATGPGVYKKFPRFAFVRPAAVSPPSLSGNV